MGNLITAITPDMVVEAYEKSGLKPIEGSFYTTNLNGEKCGCAITALAAARGQESLDAFLIILRGPHSLNTVNPMLNLSNDFSLEEFYCGFDKATERDSDEYKQGKAVRLKLEELSMIDQ